jgi:Ran GTPase-activating protein (RanGAP) involved in mRNA processing and transport
LRICSGGETFLYKVADIKLRTAEENKNVIADIQMQMRSNMSLKICGNAVGTVLPSSCGVVIADMKKIVPVHL